MAIPSDLFATFARLGSRLRYRGSPTPDVDTPQVSNTVIPITNFDVLLLTPTIPAQVTLDISAGAGTYTPYFTVPSRKRWTLKAAFRDGTTGTCRTRIRNASTRTIPLSANTGTGGNLDMAVLHSPITLDEGWSIGLDTTGNGADTAIGMFVMYDEEDAF